MNEVPFARRWMLAIALVMTLGAIGQSGGIGYAQNDEYPGDKAVTLIAPSSPGGGWDLTARSLAETLQKEGLIDHPLPVVNQPGATGAVSLSQLVTQHEGDPYQLSITSLPIMFNALRGDSDYGYQDVTMIARLMTEYFTVVVPKDSSYPGAPELLDAVIAEPGSVPIAASGDDRLPFALLVQAAGGDPLKINFIGYEGGGEQITALLSGDVKAAIAGASEFRGQIESGDLRGVAVLKEERLAGPYAEIPTAQELGYDVTLANWRGVMGPPGMPEDAVTYWQEKIENALQTETWKEIAAKNQWETTYMDGEEFDEYLGDVYTTIEAALKSTGEIE